MTVSSVYCPSNYGIGGPVPPKHFSPVLPPNQSEPSDVASGSVALQITLDSSAAVKGVDFLHGMEFSNNFVSAALEKWRFQTFNEKPIKSKTVSALPLR
jgi:hypothetical protein